MPDVVIKTHPGGSEAEAPNLDVEPTLVAAVPRRVEAEALAQAEILLLFATENSKDLPPSVVKTIADSPQEIRNNGIRRYQLIFGPRFIRFVLSSSR
jgi:hypothetical protein